MPSETPCRRSFRHCLLRFDGLACRVGGCLALLVTISADILGAPVAGETHWAFHPPVRVAPPSGGDAASINPLDAFIDARLREFNLSPSPAASKSDRLRRVTFDLTGLPPTVDELTDFLGDESPKAWERVVDRLLASPSYGERWAQHWLDLAHYADSNGFELDADRPDAWRYRDWVIEAFNQDLPYDQFLTLQVAGDEAAPGNSNALIASGFGRAGPREVVAGNIDPEVRRQNELTEVTTSVGSVFMGLTLGCARCHDHKFDPLPTVDYYGMEAFFAGTQLRDTRITSDADTSVYDLEAARVEALLKPLHQAKEHLEEPYRLTLRQRKEQGLGPSEKEVRSKKQADRTPEEDRLAAGTEIALQVGWEEIAEEVSKHRDDWKARESLKRQIYELHQQMPRPPPRAMALMEEATPPPATAWLKRGNIKDKRAIVEPHPPRILAKQMGISGGFASPTSPIDSCHSGRRLALARWMTATNHPLTARVLVNRLWQHHFGRGIVATSSDFGVRGDPPTHPELLDWLASELIRNGWRLKPIHRLLLTSKAYQRTSQPIPENSVDSDPENRYLSHMNRHRMDAEGLRDSILAVSGILNPKRGGPGVHLPLEPEVQSLIFSEQEEVELWRVDPEPSELRRRSIYAYRKRNVHYPIFDAFDAPDALTPCPVRTVSTHAPQALVLLNGSFILEAAELFAHSLAASASSDPGRINEAFLRCFARQPTARETSDAEAFLDNDPRRWKDFALALLNSNEFIYVP